MGGRARSWQNNSVSLSVTLINWLRRARRVVIERVPMAFRTDASTVVAAVAAVLLLAGDVTVMVRILGIALAGISWLAGAARLLQRLPMTAGQIGGVLCSGLLLTIGTGGLYLTRAVNPEVIVWSWCGVLMIALWLAGCQPQLLRTKPLAVANLSAANGQAPVASLSPALTLRVWWGVIGATGVLAAVAAPVWALGVLALLATLVSLVTTAVAWRFADHARYRVLREIKRLRPKFVVPYDGTLTYQVEMWEAYFRLLAVPYLIVTLKPATLEPLASMTNVPVIVPAVDTVAEIDAIIPASVRVAFYPHNSGRNSIFLANNDIKSVFVHHGDGDKPPSYAAKSARYDHLFVAGQAAIDRYANHGVTIPEEKFHIIGRPQADNILLDRSSVAEKSHPVVLYAPTWQGKRTSEDYSSLPMGLQIVNGLLSRGARVIFRPHPASKCSAVHRRQIRAIQQALEADRQQTGLEHVWGHQAESGWTVADVSNVSDAMISDASGIVTDFMQSAKPYAMVSTRMSAAEFKKCVPTSVGAYVIDRDPVSLDLALDDLLGADPLSGVRWRRRTYYLGGFLDDGATRAFLAESRKLLGESSALWSGFRRMGSKSLVTPLEESEEAVA